MELKGGAGEVGGVMVLWEKGSRQQTVFYRELPWGHSLVLLRPQPDTGLVKSRNWDWAQVW